MKKITRMSSLIIASVAFMAASLPFNALASSTTGATKAHAVAASRVNLNKADAKEISARHMKGIGKKRAEEIVAYRESNGPFKTWDDLANVKGFGKNFVKSHRKELKQAFTLG